MDAPLAPVLAAIITVTTIALIFTSLHQTGAVQLWAMLPMFGWFAFIFLMVKPLARWLLASLPYVLLTFGGDAHSVVVSYRLVVIGSAL